MAPTLSFWDCGEFIACSITLGVPHPPGSPFLLLLGRVFSLIPFYDFRGNGFSELAYRVNMISAIPSALAVMLIYLIVVKLILRFRNLEKLSLEGRLSVWFAGLVTAFLAAWGDTFWFNAVEAETYALSVFLSMLILWLGLTWCEKRHKPSSVRYLFLAAYLIGLGVGVHLLSLLIAPILLILIITSELDRFRDWQFWVAITIVLGLFGLFQYKTGMKSTYLFAGILAIIGLTAAYFLSKNTSIKRWKVTFCVALIGISLYIIGYSCYPTVMVRAKHQPSINENDPSNWERYQLYMAREQYGGENMLLGMFDRAADDWLRYQFGFMYLRYFLKQFPPWLVSPTVTFTNNRTEDGREVDIRDPVPLAIIPLLVLLFGLFYHFRRDPQASSALFAFFLLSSIGLVLYLDMRNPQVRERDYFFAGSFFIITVWIGLGAFALLEALNRFLSKNPGKSTPFITFLAGLVFLTFPLESLRSNYFSHNRSGDTFAHDYGYNILSSCDKDAILFTNGDNDTFPLWFLQEVKGIRKDIRIVNLSLLNTNWYIKQLRDFEPKLSIQYSDKFIDETLCGRTTSAMERRLWRSDKLEITSAGLTWDFPRSPGEQLIRVQHIMVWKIIEWNFENRPIYFAVTVAKNNMIGINDYLRMEGMVYRLVPTKAPMQKSTENLERNFMELYTFGELVNPDVYKSPNTLKLSVNYIIGYVQLAEALIREGKKEKALEVIEKCERTVHLDMNWRLWIAALFTQGGLLEAADRQMDKVMAHIDTNDSQTMIDFAGTISSRVGMINRALSIYQSVIARDPHAIEAYKGIARIQWMTGDTEGAIKTAEILTQKAPDDEEGRLLLESMKSQQNEIRARLDSLKQNQ